MGTFPAFLSCVLIWGSTWYAIEWQLGTVPPSWSVTYRFGLAAILLGLWCLKRGVPLVMTRRQHIITAGIGLFMFSSNYIIVYYGTQYLTSGLVAVCFSLLSFLNILGARIVLKTPIKPSLLFAALLGMSGLALIFLPEVQSVSLEDTTMLGIIICIVSTVFAAAGNTISATESARNINLLALNFWGMTYGTSFNIVLSLLTVGLPVFDPRPEYWIALVYLSLFGSIFAFVLYLSLIGKIGVGQSGYIMVLTPIVALIISTLFEGFEWSLPAISGLSLVIVGNIMMIRSRKPTPRREKIPVQAI
ncbi:membrane protein [Kordiimonas sediminis]|uniref:Membrane protein n=1 Tax=Kordiimonas sediminis TaxID=1735581 RepID=A0A919E7N3_9PROT|nr:DMT family transporter [Kordiimonas sediminis]GHF22542.1 membrane protein [Kordiimonas sediminis]